MARLESGHTPSRRKPEYWGGDIPWIGIRDATGNHGRTLIDTQQHTNQLGIDNSSARVLPANTVCLSRTASVGYVVVMGVPMATSQDFVNWVCSPGLDHRFLKYVLLAEHDTYLSFASGTTHQTIYYPEVKAFHVCLPPILVQRRIGDVLQSLDDLLENNRRRVAVVQEMARAIYREWFVHFRFPGHEDATFFDSDLGPIPEDWSAVSLDSVASVVRGRSYRKAELVGEGEGLPFLNLKCMQRGGGFRRDGLKWYDGQFKDAQLTGLGDIVLAVTDLTQGREILARATLVPSLPMERGVISLDVAKIVPTNPADRLWIFGALRWSDFADRVKEFANGSTVLHLSPTHVAEAMVLWASEDLRRRFADAIGPMLELANELSDAADRAAGVRDLLLPKLVTGQIDVSDLDLDAVVEKAGV